MADPLPVLRVSHEQLAEVVRGLDDAALTGPSYCDDWNVAQVLSHLGSGAEIGQGLLRKARGADGLPDSQEIWARWDAMSPTEMAAGYLAANDSYLAAYEGIDEQERLSLLLPFFTGPTPVGQVLMFRLTEHALHSWDVRVLDDPQATVLPAAVPLLLELTAMTAQWAAKPAAVDLGGPARLAITLTEPDREFVFTVADGQAELAVDADAGEATGTLRIPAEAFVRLTTGRLDPDHTPAGVESTGSPTLDELRLIFPGF
jgi:uncharacterized protein (TIGR03083 family)